MYEEENYMMLCCVCIDPFFFVGWLVINICISILEMELIVKGTYLNGFLND